MMKAIRTIVLLLALLVGWSSHAADPVKVNAAVDKIIQKYGDKEGVDHHTFVKGEGLEFMKMMLNKEFGRKFMKGVKKIVIIDYAAASAEVCNSMHDDLMVFATLMEEYDLTEMKEYDEKGYVKFFASPNDSGSLAQFLVVVEEEGDKMFMFMDGEIIIES